MAAILTFPEWKPDLSDYETGSSLNIKNVVPRSDGYGPFPDFTGFTSALAAICRGSFCAFKSDGSVVIFKGTSTRLWRLDNTTFTWVPVSKALALTSISNASPAVFSLNSHGLSVGDAFVLSTSGTLPTGLTAGTVYYVISAGFGVNSFQASTTAGGSAVNTSGAGSGTHSFTSYYTALPSTRHWQFRQFGDLVIAVQPNAAPQKFDLSSSSAFANLGGSPPQAAFIEIVGRFVVLTGLTSEPYRIHWSGLNDPEEWTSGTNSSDFQDFPDGGTVRGVAGGEFGVIFQETVMRRMIYAPGSDIIFQIERIADDIGLHAPYSLISSGGRIYWLASQGFYGMVDTGLPQPIGKERFDRTFFADYDSGNIQLIIGAKDPQNSRVYWAYKSQAGAAGQFDKIICYDYTLNQATSLVLSGEYLSSSSRPGLTLENLDDINSSIDAFPFSLDDVSTAALTKLSAVDTSHVLGFYVGDNLEATLETSERGGNGRRIFVRGMRPITDADEIYCAVGARETLQASASYSTETLINAVGMCPARVSTRYARGKARIPSGEDWSFITGLEPDVAPEGQR